MKKIAAVVLLTLGLLFIPSSTARAELICTTEILNPLLPLPVEVCVDVPTIDLPPIDIPPIDIPPVDPPAIPPVDPPAEPEVPSGPTDPNPGGETPATPSEEPAEPRAPESAVEEVLFLPLTFGILVFLGILAVRRFFAWRRERRQKNLARLE